MVAKPIFTAPPGPVPQRSSPSTFAPRMDRWLRWDSIERAKFPLLVEYMADRANVAEAAAEAAAIAAGATSAGPWVSGATYAQGVVVYSEVDFNPYRAKIMHTGQSTDPSADSTHWGPATIVNVQTGPTDATPGAMLTVGAFGLGTIDPPLISDFGAELRPGFYRFYEHTATGSPGSEQFYGSAIVGNADGGRQFIIAARTASTIADTRVWFGSNGWPAGGGGSVQWLELFHSKNLVGPVTEDDGVATGAAFEPGENVNGRYVRLADGTMLAWIDNLTVADDGTTAWAYPAAFSATPAVTITNTGDSEVALRIGAVGLAFAAEIEAVHEGLGAETTVALTAIGKWN